MTNKEWLDYLAHNAPDELAAWFDAEHVENQERALDGDTAALNARIAELTAERDKLTNAINELQKNQPYCYNPEQPLDSLNAIGRYIDELTAERENWKEHSRTIEYRCKKAETDCEIYRKKFGKCIDYADAIHALMDDEGMA